ncbi:hypothetical protein VPH35_056129 [Triticum aestivum]
MARFNGATVLLILITTVSVYTCAIIAGAALGWTLGRSTTTKQAPSDRALRVSMGFLAEDFAKELWSSNRREGRPGRALAGAGGGTPRASQSQHEPTAREGATQHEWALQPVVSVADNMQVSKVHTGGAARPWSRHSNFSEESTEKRPGRRGVIKVGPWGGSGGKAFYKRRGRDVKTPRVRSVTLYHTEAIISFHQSSQEAGVKHTSPPAESDGIGAVRIPNCDHIIFASDEQLIVVEGTYDHYKSFRGAVVTSLVFRTDKGRTYGPYGVETGTPFSIPTENGCIVGFWGRRSDWILDAIGVYIRPC